MVQQVGVWELKRILRELVSERFPGPSLTFSELHVIRALQVLGERGVMGRTLLSETLAVGPGAIRTLLSRLESLGIIKIEKAGCKLTSKGLKMYQHLSSKIALMPKVDGGGLSLAKFDSTVIIKDAGSHVKMGIEQRDAAIRAGAKGATTIVFKKGKFTIPVGSDDCAKDFPGSIWIKLETSLKPEDNDVIIICSADTEVEAVYGALAAALTLVE